jgi:2,4-dienoyl-CoA reductase (NADPH2)
MGREEEYPIENPAEVRKRVLVVGAGPGGMEAARVASARGHQVTLCDQSVRLGGALLLASVTNRRLEPFLRYVTREMGELPIEIKLGARVTPELVERMAPDAAVLALGGAPRSLDVPGEDSGIVLSRRRVQSMFGAHVDDAVGVQLRIAYRLAALFIKYFYSPAAIRWLLRFGFPFGRRVAVVGGDFAGCELAETLLDRGKSVAIVEETGRFGADVEMTHRWVLLRKLREAGARMIKGARVVEITGKGLRVVQGDSTEFIEADTVVKVGITANPELTHELEGKIAELYVVGDGADPGRLMEAVASGFLVGQKV